MSGVSFGSVPIVAPFGMQQGVALSAASVVLPLPPIEILGTGYAHVFSLSSPGAAIPKGMSFACGFGIANAVMPMKEGLDFQFGAIPIIVPTGLRI